MNNATQFEGRASRSRSKHKGESSNALCDRFSRTRDTSPRQLPTDHDCAVSTREYQTDQSSLTPAPTAAGPALEKRQKLQQRQKQPHRCAGLTGSLHISAWSMAASSTKSCAEHAEYIPRAWPRCHATANCSKILDIGLLHFATRIWYGCAKMHPGSHARQCTPSQQLWLNLRN